MPEWNLTKHVVGKKMTLFSRSSSDFGLIEVSRYKLMPGDFIELHFHSSKSETYLLLHGELEFVIDGEKVTKTFGEFVIIPAKINHSVMNKGNEIAEFIIHHIEQN